MMYFLSVVLIGTVYPIFLDVISSEQISVGPPFYHRLIIPFLIPFLLIMAIGPKLDWISATLKQKFNLIVFLLISFFLAGFIVVNLNVEFLVNTILIGSSFYLFFLTLSDLFKNKLLNISQNISHFGFSVLILSILFNNIFSSEIITNMKIGEVYKKDQIEISFQNIEQKKEKNFNSIIGTFNITDSENKSIILKPQLRIFNQPNIITSEADIKTTLFSDKFMVMNVVQNQEYFNVRYQIKPFMVWVWISVIIISLGGLVSFYRKI
jgi:cytochrome c-type biogenesis protein CcmF